MEDELFAAKYDNHDKNIDDCVTYILNWVQKSGCNGFCDDEIYGQAIHYYEEKDIEVGKPLNCQVSVNHHIELTEEEKACLLYTSDAADESRGVDLGGRRIIKKIFFSSRRRHTRLSGVSWARRCV